MSQTAPKTIQSPIPGVFYQRANPQAEPYVKEGDRVKAGDVVGLVEVMKQFFELKAEHEAVVSRFLVEDASEIDIGQDVIELR